MSDNAPPPDLPSSITWAQRPFPDANFLLLDGAHPAMVDSGFVAHAQDTADWADAHTNRLELVVNTHWHSDHVGANGLLQTRGTGIAASAPDAAAVARRDPGCCAAEYLDQPVAPYDVDRPLNDADVLPLGDTEWEVIATPGHTPGHLCLWQPDERILVVGDALSDYDVGWVNLALDGLDAATTALTSLLRLADLDARVVLPAHGPAPADPTTAITAALRRTQRLVDDPDGAVWYGARRIFAFALMIRDGIPLNEVGAYLRARHWLIDAARLLRTTPDALADELVASMTTAGAIIERDTRVHAAAPHPPLGRWTVPPFPRAWNPSTPGENPRGA